MAYQTTFKRYEIKYMLDRQQKQRLLLAMQPYMRLDSYGRTTIRNIYYDTDTYRLIRHSLEKPAYKEKLRIRSYQPAGPDDPVFVELKKKYDSVVYKRRLVLHEADAMDCFRRGLRLPVHSQIASEIDYFRRYYETLHPTAFLTYEREAYYEPDGGDFRLTLDENILYRESNFSLGSDIYGLPLLADGYTLLEIKTSGGIPLWMCHAINDLHLFKTSFSKYGAAYQRMMTQKAHGGLRYA